MMTLQGHLADFAVFGDDYDTPDGTAIRDYIHVEDLADAHLLALDGARASEHRVFNLGNGNGVDADAQDLAVFIHRHIQ